MIKRRNIYLVMALLLGVQVHAQVAVVRTYGGNYFEEGQQVIQTNDGGYAVIGTTGSDQEQNTDFYLLRLDSDLNCLWSRYYGGPAIEWGYSIVSDDLGNLVMCGYTNSSGAGGYDVLVVKVDINGDELWRHTYGGEDWDFGYKIIRHPEGGYFIAGETWSMGNGNSDGYLLHIDGSGDLVDEWTYGGEGVDGFRDVTSLDDNSVLVCGEHGGFATEDFSQLWSVKLDLSGEITWQYLHGSNTDYIGRDIAFVNSNKIFVGGDFATEEDGMDNLCLVQLNGDGEEVFLFEEFEKGIEVIQPTNDFIITAGNSDNSGNGGFSAVIHRRNLDGIWITGASFGDIKDEFCTDLLFDDMGRVLMLGSSNSYSLDGNADIYLVLFPDEFIVPDYTLDVMNDPCFSLGSESNFYDNSSGVQFSKFGSEIRLENLNGEAQIDIYAIDGRHLATPVIAFDNFSSDLSALSPGLYVCLVTNKFKEKSVFQFIINQ